MARFLLFRPNKSRKRFICNPYYEYSLQSTYSPAVFHPPSYNGLKIAKESNNKYSTILKYSITREVFAPFHYHLYFLLKEFNY